MDKVITPEPISISPVTYMYETFRTLGYNDTLSRYFTAQAGHETNNFTSAIYKSNNNAFGMKFAGQSLSLGVKNGYANYTSVYESIKDLAAWYSKHRNALFSFPLIITDLSSYVDFLKNNNYFEADKTEYLRGCNYFYNMYFQ